MLSGELSPSRLSTALSSGFPDDSVAYFDRSHARQETLDADILVDLDGEDLEVVHRMVELRLEETEGHTGYPQLPYHRVVTIGVAWLDGRGATA